MFLCGLVFLSSPVLAGETYKSLEQLRGTTIGTQTGTAFDDDIYRCIPDVTLEYYNSKADMVAALDGGKISGFVMDEPAVLMLINAYDNLTYIPEYLNTYDFAYIFSRDKAGETLCGQMNEFLKTFKENKGLEKLKEKWFSKDESVKKMPDIDALSGKNGTLTMATNTGYEPFEYVRDGEIVGYDIEMAILFCEAFGYKLELLDMNFDAIIPSIQSGKCNFGGAGITITPERQESMLFSDSNITCGAMVVVKKAREIKGMKGFLESIKDSFHKTFIKEQRWQLFLAGGVNTILITFWSIICGTALGFLLFMLCRNGNRVANNLTDICTWLIQGTPMVVLLMIIYYIVFGKISVSGIVISILGFTLTFSSSVLGMLRMGVGAVHKGQYEAASALGYTNTQTFFKFIFPQAMPHILPGYKSEVTSLIKATAVVGYIAVQDLTRMSDIVRSRTYEAFFPLISVTVIYFVLEGTASFLISRLTRRFDPSHRSKETILKGVKYDDKA